MSSSLVEFRKHGFWLSDGVLQVLLHYAAEDLRVTHPLVPWANKLANHWAKQAQMPAGYLFAELDAHLTDQQRVDTVVATAERLHRRFDGLPNGVVPKDMLNAAGIGGRGVRWAHDGDAKWYLRALDALCDLLTGNMNSPVATAPVLRLS